MKETMVKKAMDTLDKYIPDLPKLTLTDVVGGVHLPDGIKVYMPDQQFGFAKVEEAAF